MQHRRTKIVATVGPACSGEADLAQLLGAGVDVCRINFSHGSHAQHAEFIRLIRQVADAAGRPVAILQDLQGPRIRTGRLRDSTPVHLLPGALVTIAPGDFLGDAERLATGYDRLADDVQPGNTILLCDGLIELKVLSVEAGRVLCEVIAGGKLGEHEGMNLPGVDLSISAPTEKDLADLAFGLEQGVDYVALSFVRRAEDIVRLREEITRLDSKSSLPIIAKIERPEAVDSLDAILAQAGGVMVARGDLGIEMPTESVPVAQKRIIAAANAAGVPVITATQMLESMIHHRRPTRAEASDVANAILDGTDAVMLSGETAVGDYPVECVRVMARIAREAESLLGGGTPRDVPHPGRQRGSQQRALSEAARRVASDLGADGIVAFTITGSTARALSQQRPQAPLYALTPNEATCRRLALVWGVMPIMFPLFGSTDEMIERGEGRLLNLGLARVGDTMICVAGASTNTPGGTDMLKIHYFDGQNPYADEARS